MITRFIEKPLREALFQWKTLIIYGPRQVGKTTLVRRIIDIPGKKTIFYDAESANTREYLQPHNIEQVLHHLAGYDIIAIDEAQKIIGIGSMLKYLHDHLPKHVQIIATGSSAFDLAQKTRESMVGRVRDFFLTPFTTRELVSTYGRYDVSVRLSGFLMYGMYPASLLGGDERRESLELLAGGLLYKDIIEIDGIRKSQVILQLLRLLALQIGSEVSYSELAQKLGISTVTVQKYIYLLEESFIVFTLSGLSRNLRNEITKSPKIYFYDVGIRNALIGNFASPDLRTDIWALWENYIIAEMVKQKKTMKLHGNSYFWRTHAQQEIDYIDDYDGILHAHEIKWSPRKAARAPRVFQVAYPDHIFAKITRENWIEMLTDII